MFCSPSLAQIVFFRRWKNATHSGILFFFFFVELNGWRLKAAWIKSNYIFLWQCCWLRSKWYVLSCVSLASGSPQVKTFELDETACAVNLVAIQYNFDFNHICFWFSLWYCISWLFDFICCSSAVGMWHWQFYGMLDAICASHDARIEYFPTLNSTSTVYCWNLSIYVNYTHFAMALLI